MTAAPVFCPRCGEEYLASTTECVDCGVPLVAESQLGSHAPGEMPPVSELVMVRASSVGWARNLSRLLADAGISHRIEAAGGDDEDDLVKRRPNAQLPFGVYVHPQDEAAALAIDEAHLRSEIPDLPDEMDAAADADTCPACGTAVSPASTECSECGLVLAFDE